MADEFILGERELADRFAETQAWSAAGRSLWLKPDGTCVHFVRLAQQLAEASRGQLVYVMGEPDTQTSLHLKKLGVKVATVMDGSIFIGSRRLPRNFPPPWTAERFPGGFVVKDANGQQLAHVYANDRQVANALTEDEARRIATNIAKLPELLKADK
jgi:hypothetical protein